MSESKRSDSRGEGRQVGSGGAPDDRAGRTPEAVEAAPGHERSGETKSYVTILEQEIESGLDELERPTRGLFFSGLSAGLDIGFSVLVLTVVLTLSEGRLPAPVVEMLKASAYSIGFILVIFGRSELFTEHTTLAVLPVLDRRATVGQLGRLWTIVYVANLVGGTLFAALLVVIGPALGIVEPEVFGDVARTMTEHVWWVILLSGLLAGWMMGLMSWLVTAARDTISEVFFVWLIAASIGLAQLHHSIVGSIEVLVGVFSDPGLGALDFVHFLAFTTVGNAVGGVIFVALVKYGHATQGRRR